MLSFVLPHAPLYLYIVITATILIDDGASFMDFGTSIWPLHLNV